MKTKPEVIATVDTMLDAAGLQTYTQRGNLISELLIAHQFDVTVLRARHGEAIELLRIVRELFPDHSPTGRCIDQLVGAYDLNHATTEHKEKAA